DDEYLRGFDWRVSRKPRMSGPAPRNTQPQRTGDVVTVFGCPCLATDIHIREIRPRRRPVGHGPTHPFLNNGQCLVGGEWWLVRRIKPQWSADTAVELVIQWDMHSIFA